MRLALVPLNPTVGDLDRNAEMIADAAHDAATLGADLAVFPELALSGYPPRDLLLRDDFLDAAGRALKRLAAEPGLPPLLLGAPTRDAGGVRNSAVFLRDRAIETIYHKRLLPTYDVFDERRYFTPGDRPAVIEIAGARVGLAVCEDLWKAQDVIDVARYTDQPDPVEELAAQSPDLVVCLTASPFVEGKDVLQQRILTDAAERFGAPVLSINQLGANDEIIFDGAAHAATPAGRCRSRPRFRAETALLETGEADPAGWSTQQPEDPERVLFTALTLGVADYARKTGFTAAVLGLSGGIDSSLVAAIAAAALGPENVHAAAMPSRYSSEGSVADAREQAKRTGVRLHEIPIEEAHRAVESALEPHLSALESEGLARDRELAAENVQSRLRGLLVMGLSNAARLLPLATGNKSEMAVGYCTLYGDMNGGLAPIADLYKTRVYQLARWINDHHEEAGFAGPPIPPAVLTKAPSAELRPDQTDQDSLPPYELLDAVLEDLIERRLGQAEIARERGLPAQQVAEIAALLSRAEYKRRQMPVNLKVSRAAFGVGRRVPVVKPVEAPAQAQAPAQAEAKPHTNRA